MIYGIIVAFLLSLSPLARQNHQTSAETADLPAASPRSPYGLAHGMSNTARRPSASAPQNYRHLGRVATKSGDFARLSSKSALKKPVKATPKPLIVHCGSPRTAQVSLTFDDGPHPVYTPQILEILEQQRVHATFFVLGRRAQRYPELIREIARRGHTLANHSWSHTKHNTRAGWREQIGHTDEIIHRLVPSSQAFYRPPHGIVTPEVKRLCVELGQTIVLYTLLSSDWQRPGTQKLAEQVGDGLNAGGIVVLHDGGGNRTQTVEALPLIIEKLKKRKLTPVTLDALLKTEPYPEMCNPPKKGKH